MTSSAEALPTAVLSYPQQRSHLYWHRGQRSASISSSLCDMTTRAAMSFAAGPAVAGPASVTAMALAREVLRSMLLSKLRFLAISFLFFGAVATGACFVGQALARQAGKPVLHQIAAKLEDANLKPAPGRMFVIGRVLDPNGKPVPATTIVVYARDLGLVGTVAYAPTHQVPIGNALADGSGRFRIDAPRTSSSRHDTFGAIALAPGYGVGWVALTPDDDQPTADITLRPEQVIPGRLFDLQGRPVPNVTLAVASIRQVRPQEPSRGRGSRFDSVAYSFTKISDFAAWPKPVTTDAEGR